MGCCYYLATTAFEDIANLELTAISFWHNNSTIRQFLAESTLDNDGDRRDQRLRIDMGRESGAPKACRGGRKRIASTPAPTPHATFAAESAPSTAPLRVSLHKRIQILVCGPSALMNQAAAAGAVELRGAMYCGP